MLTDDMKIACCKTCLLADVMKPCKHKSPCTFQIGLLYKTLESLRQVPLKPMPETIKADYLQRVKAVNTNLKLISA